MLPVVRSVLERFKEALDYSTNRSRKRFQHFLGHVASNLAKFVIKLCSQLREMEVNKKSLFFILAFLKRFGRARDKIACHEGVGM